MLSYGCRRCSWVATVELHFMFAARAIEAKQEPQRRRDRKSMAHAKHKLRCSQEYATQQILLHAVFFPSFLSRLLSPERLRKSAHHRKSFFHPHRKTALFRQGVEHRSPLGRWRIKLCRYCMRSALRERRSDCCSRFFLVEFSGADEQHHVDQVFCSGVRSIAAR